MEWHVGWGECTVVLVAQVGSTRAVRHQGRLVAPLARWPWAILDVGRPGRWCRRYDLPKREVAGRAAVGQGSRWCEERAASTKVPGGAWGQAAVMALSTRRWSFLSAWHRENSA